MTGGKLGSRSSGPNFVRQTAPCWNTGILLIIAPNCPFVVDFAQIQTNSTAFLIIASDTLRHQRQLKYILDRARAELQPEFDRIHVEHRLSRRHLPGRVSPTVLKVSS